MKTTSSLVAIAGLVAFTAAYAAEEKNPPPKAQPQQQRMIAPPGPRGERRVLMTRDGEGEKEIVTFLGVDTGPVSPTLTAQLGLPKDSGLVVNHIVPQSPAAGALQEHDILLRLDDQLLIDQRQLSVLIRNHKDGDEVTLTFVRGGKQATAKVKLAQHEVPKVSMMLMEKLPAAGAVTFSSGAGAPELPFPPPNGPDGRRDVDHVLSLIGREPEAGLSAGKMAPGTRVFINREAGPGFRAMSVNPGNSNIVFSDDAGSLELTLKDGRKTLVAKNAKGDQLFSGPVNTPEERNAMPPDVRQRLEKLEGMQDVTFRTDGDFRGAETKTIRPFGQGISLPQADRPVLERGASSSF
jgi:hypothetical protein